MTPILSPLHQNAQCTPNTPALYHCRDSRNHSIDYLTLSQHVIACGQQLKHQGISPSDRLACIDDNSLELVILYWVCVDLGLLFCPLSPRFPKAQIAKLAAKYGYHHFWAQDNYRALLPQRSLSLDFMATSTTPPTTTDLFRPTDAILTSGSSGEPKSVVHCLDNHISSAVGAAKVIELGIGDSWLMSLPLFHISGLAIINRCAMAKAAITLPTTTMTLIEQLKQQTSTHISLVETQLINVLKSDVDALSKVKVLLLGGGAIAPKLLKALKPFDIKTYTSYGMSEMSSQITTGLATNKGTSGRLLENRQLKIVNQQIYVKGRTLFLGYLQPNMAQELHIDIDDQGWFDTKDRGHLNARGELTILGRSDNMFICGGENVHPEEIETALRRHPDIEDAIVFALDDNEFGHLPAAVIKGKLPDIAKLNNMLGQTIAAFKRPRHYYLWPDIEPTAIKTPRQQIIAAALTTTLTK